MQRTHTETYNGWTNYETWCVHLWLTNEGQSVYEIAKAWAQAGVVKDAITEQMVLEHAGLFNDLITHALGRVNWDEITAALLE